MLAFLLNVAPVRGAHARTSHLFRQCQPRFHVMTCVASNSRPKSTSASPVHKRSPRNRLEPLHPNVLEYLSYGMSVVILCSGKSRLFQSQSPTTVYPAAIKSTHSHITSAEDLSAIAQSCPVAVLDASHNPFAYGIYNPASMFRIRLLRLLYNENDQANHKIFQWNPAQDIQVLVQKAMHMRTLIGLPKKNTDAYRLVNGDGDGISGLFVDRFGTAIVISSCAAWCETYKKDIERAITEATEDFGIEHVIWRPQLDRLRQDGFDVPVNKDKKKERLSANQDSSDTSNTDVMMSEMQQEPLANDTFLNSPQTEQPEMPAVVAKEEGVLYELPLHSLQTGQKTGHFADQREARVYIRNLVESLTSSLSSSSTVRMLDLFCYSGGFSLNAAVSNPSGKVQVTAVDSSIQALRLAERNAKLNGVSDVVKFLRADVSKYIRDYDGKRFDVVIVDPPKFAPNAKALPRALGKYKRINEQAMSMVREEGGILVTCSCSAAIAHQRHLLIEAVREGGVECGRELRLLKTFGGAADHPVHTGMLETEYLTVCVFAVR